MVFDVRVIPRASKSEIVGEYNGNLKVKLSSPPIDGAANKELINLFSKHLKIPKGSIEMIKGETSRLKTISVKDVNKSTILDLC